MNAKAIDIARAAIHARGHHGSANVPQQRKADPATDFGAVAVHPALRTRLAQRREIVLCTGEDQRTLAQIRQQHAWEHDSEPGAPNRHGAEVATVRIQRLSPGQRQHHAAEREERIAIRRGAD